MKVVFRKSFERDLRKLRGNASVLARVQRVVEQVEAADGFDAIVGMKKMQGWSSYYRIRIGDYRVGLKLEEDVVVFLRCLHRRDIYRRFP